MEENKGIFSGISGMLGGNTTILFFIILFLLIFWGSKGNAFGSDC